MTDNSTKPVHFDPLLITMARPSHQRCPFCNSDDIHLWKMVTDHKVSGELFRIDDCRSCGLRFTQDPPAEQDAGPYYDSPNYISHSDNRTGLMFKAYHLVRGYMLGRKRDLIRRYSSGKRLIDVGSGTGYFLNTMKSAGYEVTGIEINEGARRFSQTEFGLEVFEPKVLKERKLNGKFHIATMWHVLEHLYSPETYLSALHSILEEDGILLIAVPNHRSSDADRYQELWAGYDVPRHLWHFSKDTLVNLMKPCGFSHIASHRLPFDAFYVSMLSEKYKGGRFYFLYGMFAGWLSWISSQLNINRPSSLIYVFKKNTTS